MKQAEKLVELVISYIDDVSPFPQDDAELKRGRIILNVWMTDEQIAYNRMVLLGQQIENWSIPEIRMVK